MAGDELEPRRKHRRSSPEEGAEEGSKRRKHHHSHRHRHRHRSSKHDHPKHDSDNDNLPPPPPPPPVPLFNSLPAADDDKEEGEILEEEEEEEYGGKRDGLAKAADSDVESGEIKPDESMDEISDLNAITAKSHVDGEVGSVPFSLLVDIFVWNCGLKLGFFFFKVGGLVLL